MPINIPGYNLLEVVYEGTNTVIYRAVKASERESVIIKTLKTDFPTVEELIKLRHEFQVLQPLNINGIVKPLALLNYQNSLALILQDFKGESLDKFWANQEFNLTSFLVIAIQLAATLADIHQNNIIHKDIKPNNILVNSLTGEVKIIDFSIAACLSTQSQTVSNPNSLEGTLAYIAPEQTGRMNRAIDYRADFYSLGVTFYEILTNQLPYQTNDPLELIHCHIAKTPIPPHLINLEIPQAVSNIVMKLLAKTAEERYQSAIGLKADLEICLKMWQSQGEISHFQVGELDSCSQFAIPQKLYGRELEVRLLLDAFERVSGSRKTEETEKDKQVGEIQKDKEEKRDKEDVFYFHQSSVISHQLTVTSQQSKIELVLISGYSGIGKSSLVQEIQKPVVEAKGYFISGKFDQFQRNIPYSALINAFQQLVKQLLTESEEKLTAWKEKLLAALGTNGQVIIDVVPEVELIIGNQPAVVELAPTEAQNRFNLLFQNFIRVFCAPTHPLVIFLDDLQWADSATLKLLEVIMTDAEGGYLLLIGAYRDREVSPSHPLMISLNSLQSQAVVINNIILAPLTLADISNLIADTLHSEAVTVQPLAQLVIKKTSGNPFFVNQFLKTLYQENLLTFNYPQTQHNKGCWRWDLEQIEALGITDNVVELMTTKLKKLPDSTQQVLQLAACVGNTFDLNTLAIIYKRSRLLTYQDILPAIQENLILSVSELKITSTEIIDTQADSLDFKFLHDRVQQAAYVLIDESYKKTIHLQIGRLLWQSNSSATLSENIFAIVDHLNLGIPLISDESEQNEIAKLNLIAGQKAKAATAYTAANEYLQLGLKLLADSSWTHQYDLTLALHNEAAEAAYLSGDFAEMQRLAEVVQNCATSILDIVKVYEVQIQAYMGQNKLLSALNTGLVVLKQLGIEFPDSPNPSDIGQALGETAAILSGKRTEELINLPEMTAPHQLAAIRILSSLFSACYTAVPPLVPLIVCKQVNLSVRYGNAAVSPFAYAVYSLLLCGAVGDIERGYEFGQLALRLVSKLNAKEIAAKTCHLVYAAVQHWKEHARNCLEPFLAAFSSGVETGDLEYAGYAIMVWSHYSFFVGKQLTPLEREIETYTDAIHKISQETALNNTKICWQAVLNVMGRNQSLCQLKGQAYDEEKMLPLHQQTNDQLAIHYLYLHKLVLCYLFENYSEALQAIPQIESSFGASTGQLTVVIFYFYDSLVRLAVYDQTLQSQQQGILERVQANQEKMLNWAHYAPMNHLQKYYLVEAERQRFLGEKIAAMEMYDKAIALAKENEYLNEEALAYELAAKFYLSWGKEEFARLYMQKAHYVYHVWGAQGKVEYLARKYPQLIAITSTKTKNFSPTITESSHKFALGKNLDLETFMKASQAISSEIVLGNLLNKLIKIAIENAGAETGFLVVEKSGELFIEAQGMIADNDVKVWRSPLLADLDNLPISIIKYVERTREDVVLEDAAEAGIFATDAYIINNKPKSVLCTPLIHQGKLIGILYLENNLTTNAFTSERLEILKLLSSPAAIALENARLYTDLEAANKGLETKVSERTLELQEKNQLLQQEIRERLRAEQAAAAANEAKSEFLANMSHELRTPLNGILGYAQILRREKNLSDLQKSGINTIHRCGEHLLTLINDVLDLSKIEARKMDLYLNELHFPDFLAGIVDICQIRAEQKGIEFIYKTNSNLPEIIQADEKRLRQVLLNLLGNAVKFTDKGKVTFQVGVLENNILAASMPKIRFQIEDTGIGMKTEQIEDIFLPFKQVGEQRRQIEGTGLGLSISSQLVEMMGGKIKVESTEGKGSIFWFDLDLQQVHRASSVAKIEQRRIIGFAGSPRKILVVDDREANRTVLTNLLQPLGFETIEATNGQDGLQKAEQFHPDAILMDLVMPVMDGFEATRKIRISPKIKHVVIIATSASVFAMDRQQSREVGCDDFIAKPIREAELLTLLGEYLHLEWIYEEKAAGNAVQANPKSQIENPKLVAPSAAEIASLLDLAMMGDIKAIAQQAAKLEMQDPQLLPFATHLRQLAKGFKGRQIIEFIKQFQKAE